MTTAAASLDLSGRFSLQGRQAARALKWWAACDGISLRLEDDTGSGSVATSLYERWLDQGVDILLGPYGTSLARRVGKIVTDSGAVLWNHGGSGDDVPRPLVVSLPAPASTYFHGAVRLAAERGLEEVVVVVGEGRFSAAVSSGARRAATGVGLPVVKVPMADIWSSDDPGPNRAVLVVGRFEEDVAIVAHLRRRHNVGLIGCVAAGLREFGVRAGPSAEGVIGPVQWLPSSQLAGVGVTGAAFSRSYRGEYGVTPDYVAAQAAAAGFLAAEAHRARLEPNDILRWRTSTLLGDFWLDQSWRQAGHRVHTIRWSAGRQTLVA